MQAAGGTIWTVHSPSVTVGEEGQLATKTGGHHVHSAVFGGQQLTVGVHYMKVEVGGHMGNFMVGIARPGLDTADGRTYARSKDGWFMSAITGDLWGNGKERADEAGGFKAGNRIGLLLDLDNHSLLFFKNGEKHGPGFGAGSVAGPVVLAMSMYWEGSSGRVVAGAVRPNESAYCEDCSKAHQEGIQIVGHGALLQPFDNGSTSWYCDRDSPQCDRVSNSNSSSGRYLGVRYADRWAGGGFDLCAECMAGCRITPVLVFWT